MTTFIIKTLGCKVNQYESQLVRENLIKNGLMESPNGCADLFIVNTCTVTHKADRDSRNIIRSCKTKSPQSKVLVTGCYVEKDADVLSKIDGIDYIVNNRDKADIYTVIASDPASCFRKKAAGERSNLCGEIASSSLEKLGTSRNDGITSFNGHSRAFVKVQDGCNNKCSYCKVNIVRQGSVSRGPADVEKEVKGLLRNGFKEIVLCGICLGDYGYEGAALTDLIRLLLKIKGDWRLRLSSIEPNYVSNELIDLMANESKLCAHLHVPFQSGDDKILKAMNRNYTSAGMDSLVKKIRAKIPQIAITTDIIVGFPGETDDSFKNTVDFLKCIQPSRTHIFRYSKRRGTPAANLTNEIAYAQVKQRAGYLEALNNEFHNAYKKQFYGENVRILVEPDSALREKLPYRYYGYTDNYLYVSIFSDNKIAQPQFKTIAFSECQ